MLVRRLVDQVQATPVRSALLLFEDALARGSLATPG